MGIITFDYLSFYLIIRNHMNILFTQMIVSIYDIVHIFLIIKQTRLSLSLYII